jgi:hypothetical protein
MPPLPNRVPEMLALADVIAVFCPSRRRTSDTGLQHWVDSYFLVQMRYDLPQRGSVTVRAGKGGWTYKQFADAVEELLKS